MIKVILVDDETLVKVGLKSIANWEKNGFEIVAEASNGEEGLALIKTHNPQLVITDIVMPKMDGIEMLKEAKEYDPDIQVIVLSSYDEFQLVRKAMKYGAWDYILKLNISEESMDKILKRVKEEISASDEKVPECTAANYDNWSMSALRSAFLTSVIEGSIKNRANIDEKLPALKLKLNEDRLCLCLIKTNLYAMKNKYCDDQDIKKLDFTISEILTEIGNEFFNGYFLKWSFGVYVMVFSLDNGLEEETKEQIDTMCSAIIEMIKKYVNLEAAIGVSNVCSGYLELSEAFKQANEAAHGMFYSGYGKTLYYSEHANTDANTDAGGQFSIDMKEDMIKVISLFDISGINDSFEIIQNDMKCRIIAKDAIYDLCSQVSCLCDIYLGERWERFKKKNGSERLEIDLVYSMLTVSEISEWLENYRSSIEECINEYNRDDKHVMIIRAKNYITENCEKVITLKSVSDYLKISKEYLSWLFHKYTGVCFTEYVNNVKIEKAQQLLIQGQYKIYEVSYMLGYDNACYFSKVFKKVTGSTPSEYQLNCVKELSVY